MARRNSQVISLLISFLGEIMPEVNSEDFELEPYLCIFALNMVCKYKQNWTWQR